MEEAKQGRGKYTSLLFIVLLFFSLALCSLFTILVGAQVYENINQRMEDNYRGQIALSYISNKVKQSDMENAISIQEVNGVEVLTIQQVYDGITYETWIYYLEGQIRELFAEQGAGLSLYDGMQVLPSEGLNFTMVSDDLIRVELEGTSGGSMLLGLRSETEGYE